jgi:glutaredoxin
MRTSMDKGNCSKCGQKIQKTASDKCMYCGTALKADQVFTKEEKEKINLDKKLLRKEQHEKEMERLREARRSPSTSINHKVSIGLGGFGSFGDGV